MKNLEIVKLNYVWGPIKDFNIKRKTFPKSIKSLEVCDKPGYQSDSGDFTIYDSIDSYFTNLYSLSIVTNRMLQNLSSGMPNLREVEIKECYYMKGSDIAAFLKANPQIEKLVTNFRYYNAEILQTILSFKYLNYWSICYARWEGFEVYNLPSNYSVKHLKFDRFTPAPFIYQFTNACKILETLELEHCLKPDYLNWSKFERRIPILKLSYKNFHRKYFKPINDSRKFNAIYTEKHDYVKDFIRKCNTDVLNNYKYIPSNSRFYVFKLIN
jgi:hypothetical protein